MEHSTELSIYTIHRSLREQELAETSIVEDGERTEAGFERDTGLWSIIVVAIGIACWIRIIPIMGDGTLERKSVREFLGKNGETHLDDPQVVKRKEF
jgi:hypothetical protein